MTVVVADTSPLSYLVPIGSIDVLPNLFSRVLVPDEVIRELRASAAPPDVRAWAEALPEWIDVRNAGKVTVRTCPSLIPESAPPIGLIHLHRGGTRVHIMSRSTHAMRRFLTKKVDRSPDADRSTRAR